jgi:ParB family chromosome partitioning protein
VESDEDMLELSLIENIQREDLNPIDIARAYQKLITDCNLTQEQVSQRVGKDRSTVANFLRLLKLPDKIQDSMRRGELEMGHGRALITIENKDLQNHLWQKIVKDKISVRQVEKLAKVGDKKKERAKTEAEIPYFIIEAEERLRTSLGTQVKVKHGRKGGIIEIEYYSDSDLERLLELLP